MPDAPALQGPGFSAGALRCICCEPLSIVQKVERDLVFAVH